MFIGKPQATSFKITESGQHFKHVLHKHEDVHTTTGATRAGWLCHVSYICSMVKVKLSLCLVKYHTMKTYPVTKHYTMKTYGGVEV